MSLFGICIHIDTEISLPWSHLELIVLLPRHAVVGLAAALATLVTAAPASAAVAPSSAAASVTVHSAARSPETIPADCTYYGTTTADPYMTCTARPAGQKWEFEMNCYIKPGIDPIHYGTLVTGDGTSTITDCVAATNPNIYYP